MTTTINPKLSFHSIVPVAVKDIKTAIQGCGKLTISDIKDEADVTTHYSKILDGNTDAITIATDVYFILFYDSANNKYKVDTNDDIEYYSAIVISITGTGVTGGSIYSAIGGIYGEFEKIVGVTLNVTPRITRIEPLTLNSASFTGDAASTPVVFVAALEKPTSGNCTAYHDLDALNIYRESTTPNLLGGYGPHDYLFISTGRTAIGPTTRGTLLDNMYAKAGVLADANKVEAAAVLEAANAHITVSKTITVATYSDSRTDAAGTAITGKFDSKKLLLITPP